MAKKRILFVDDEPNILVGLRRMLRSLRKEIDMEFAESGKEALQVMSKASFDVVVSDMRMPGMDGAELLTEVRRLYPDTIRIILSGYAAAEAIMRTETIVHQFLHKPCEPQNIKDTLLRSCQLHMPTLS
ncbi:MAG: response regulator [Desulfobulbaceae bacterium]|uniref:Response regulator n=1 Tax=Candidatus Desulfobia pelagia TaxID=2841692 RepID=A0A8J6TFD4_9BACT|nr:response regulator [Candidatus Desulfobia pelagia]